MYDCLRRGGKDYFFVFSLNPPLTQQFPWLYTIPSRTNSHGHIPLLRVPETLLQ
ncbi:hypothetical protein BDU57DRAFT_523220 [Ampelomyces quisqualis]|uniref:Uncharacterized protein n=1 Tax=Ampelomyces quisqualis TaxID=50730 RepID=A0A6A5Q9C2_AMPQU|nr:hypothetical protein BDU57DRAFT_523220 [Ampelomyces quisqualis]